MSKTKLTSSTSKNSSPPRVAYFLLNPYLASSPPNDALTQAFHELGYSVEKFSPSQPEANDHIQDVAYGYRWLARNLFSLRWRHYSAFSCTSEDPVVVAGLLAVLWRKPLIFLSDEIKSGAYSGDRSNNWKKICRWCMRRAALTIVNDEARIDLQRRYAKLTKEQAIVVYPGCFLQPPPPDPRQDVRAGWTIPDGQNVLCFSGGLNLSAGIDWALESLDDHPNIDLVAQPLSIDDLHQFLLRNHRHAQRIHIQETRLSWQESWASMGGADIGVAVYTNPADQFQLMGISSNRLCMFLAMGVPVIASRQPSFQFIEDYGCGYMVENAEEFSAAVGEINANIAQMKSNALRCSREYIDARGKFQLLLKALERQIGE